MISMGALIAADRELSHMRHSSFPAAAHTRFRFQFHASARNLCGIFYYFVDRDNNRKYRKNLEAKSIIPQGNFHSKNLILGQ